ncbi:hypothetical protein L484_016388 [Morus notabilis]|uniref:Reverse transcriptase zinc-binding domain-containing protein n=1 Tax=Morus notabilis TaxID=981085 RepID=W9RMZ4_9ROSA|nr:hypothetical protein L484_016388 [Morus notabilis]
MGVNIDEGRLSRLAGIVGRSVGSWLVKYLSLSLGGNPLQSSFWNPVVARVAKTLYGWRKAFPSKGGRLGANLVLL